MIRKHEPHQNQCRARPARNGPRAATDPPTADHRAMACVRRGPVHSAVISASVVGKAIPAATPPSTRATMRTPTSGA